MMRAKKAEIITWGKNDLGVEDDKIGLKGSPTQVVKIFTPPKRAGGQILQGETSEVVEKLINAIRDVV